jgi:hypothetical protein
MIAAVLACGLVVTLAVLLAIEVWNRRCGDRQARGRSSAPRDVGQ